MQRRGWGALLVVLVLQAGCNEILGNEDHFARENSTNADAGIDATSGSTVDAALGDAGLLDATAADAPIDRAADAHDADARGLDAASDVSCGALGTLHACASCTNDCTGLPNVSTTGVTCTGGRCAYACAADYGDCADAGVGCATHLGLATSCGACGVSCGGATPVCSRPGDGGAYACTSGCAAGQSNCNGACADLTSDPTHCGACNAPCALAQAAAGCTGSACVVAACAPGFADCDQKASTGCEVNVTNDLANCGGCGIPCSPANATGACIASTCTVASCRAGSADCDKLASTGCEVNTTNDTNNCGACGNVCNLAHATAGCTGSACAVAACATGFADCDGVAANGCETDITQPANCGGCNTPTTPTVCGAATPVCSASGCVSGCPASTPTLCSGTRCVNTTNDVNNCNACGNVCAPPNGTPTCTGSACGVSTCNTGFADCNGKPADGCEINTTSDAANCGGCSKACAPANATPVCSSSMCAVASCMAGFADCNNRPTDGCEINTTNDVKNCSGCGKACMFPNAAAACASATCAMGACSAGFADCNNSTTDGCEVNTTNDPNNCGACKAPCSFNNATASCANSSCSLTACKTGFVDCNNTTADGCETNIANDPKNCGGCTKVCSLANAVATCTNSACAVASCTGGFMDCDKVATNGCETNTTTSAVPNATNCGGCGAAFTCGGGMTCQSGACACPSGLTNCNGTCLNVKGTDVNNCGGCGLTCPISCTNGVCLKAVSIAAGGFTSTNCAVLSDGTVRCWGSNNFGQTGSTNTTTNVLTPFAVPGVSKATAVASGLLNTCAIVGGGGVECWGQGFEALGNDSPGCTTSPCAPTAVSGLTGALAVTEDSDGRDGSFSCALVPGGLVFCWGDGMLGQLAIGVAANVSTPFQANLSQVSSLAHLESGGCALLAGGTVSCWGANFAGEAGNGTSGGTLLSPAQVPGLTGVTAVYGGTSTICAVMSSGGMECWGDNASLETGTGSSDVAVLTPTAVLGLNGLTVKSVAGGFGHECALISDGTVRCWGANGSGQLGNGVVASTVATPVQVSGLTNAVQLTAGTGFTCALLSTGAVECWGTNHNGELGTGATSLNPQPTPVPVNW